MANYFRTVKFSIEPAEFSTWENLRNMHTIERNEELSSVDIPLYNVKLWYAVPKRLKGGESTEGEKAKPLYPVIYRMINALESIASHNKVVIDYNADEGLLFVVVGEGKEKLLLVNSYRAADFATAFYFLNLAVTQAMLNPMLTSVYSTGRLLPENVALIEKYFKKYACL